jgi:hypothetical protein
MPLLILKQQGRTAGTQHTVAQLRHFEDWRDLLRDTAQFSGRFETTDEVAQVFVFHLMRFSATSGEKGRARRCLTRQTIVDFTCVG